MTDEDIEAEYWAYQYEAGKVDETEPDYDYDMAAEVARIEAEAEAAEAARRIVPDVDDWEDIDG